MERVRFALTAPLKRPADRAFLQHARAIRRLVRHADIRHVGSTALAHGLTKGDLDIQVRVPRADFARAKAALGPRYCRLHGGFSSPDGVSFKDGQGSPPVGVHLTVIGGRHDIQWKHIEVLRRRPDLRARYDALKLRFQGKGMAAYRRAKARFFGALARTRGFES